MAGKLQRHMAMLVALAALACGSHAAGPAADEVDAATVDADAAVADADAKSSDADVAKDVPDSADAVDAVDAVPVDTADSGDVAPDGGQNCPGGPFCPCTGDSNCDSGKCLETPEGMQCAPTCVESGCPAGFVCKTLGAADPVNYCVSSHLSLCAPCSTNKDCQAQGVTDALCVDYGDAGHFCGGACASDNDCGTGYGCVDVPDPVSPGKSVKQCKANADVCACSAWAKTAGTITGCANSNKAGSCSGTRTCSASGLTACTAKVPQVEACNALDDDCNGQTDDLPADATCATSAYDVGGSGAPCKLASDCTASGEGCDPGDHACHPLIGTCTGKLICQAGAQSCIGAKTPKLETCNGEDDDCDGSTDEGFTYADPVTGTALQIGQACGVGACSGGSVVCGSFTAATCTSLGQVSAELCNGADDNCNGATDENTCSDGNPCSADVCDGAKGTCQHLAVEAACDDSDPCTLADACSGTTCTGTPATCDDGNPCTTDTCDSKTGACGFVTHSGSCTDGNACTSGDTCGAIPGGGWGCLPGTTVNCNDLNLCTDDACDPATGCTYASNNATQACYDGPPGSDTKGLCHSGLRYCAGGVLDPTCVDQVLPVIPEPCNGLDDSCDGNTDEGCSAASVTLSFAAAQTVGKSGTLAVNVQLAPDRSANTLQDQGNPHQVALGILAWFVRLVTGQ